MWWCSNKSLPLTLPHLPGRPSLPSASLLPSSLPSFPSILDPLAGLLLAIAWRAPPILSTPLHPGVLPQDVEPHPGPVLRHHYSFSGAWAVCLLYWRCVLYPLLSQRSYLCHTDVPPDPRCEILYILPVFGWSVWGSSLSQVKSHESGFYKYLKHQFVFVCPPHPFCVSLFLYLPLYFCLSLAASVWIVCMCDWSL